MSGSEAIPEDLAQIRKLRRAALVEGASLLILLLVAVPAKHAFGYPVAVKLAGPVHGLAFLFYAYMLVETVSGGGWRRHEVVRLVVAAFIPLGALATARLLRRKEAALTSAQI